MSSNPFRRSRVPVEPDPASANIFHGARAPADEAAASSPPPRTKTKRVVIQSPPQSPEEAYGSQNGAGRLPPVDAAAAPPPAVNQADVTIAAGGSGSESESEGAQSAYSGWHPPARQVVDGAGRLPPSSARDGAIRAPYNPFARTLATKQAAFGTLVEAPPVDEHERRVKPSLDVDAFKDILLRGAPVPAGLSSTAESTGGQALNRRSTEASFPLDPTYGPPPESPTDAHHDYGSGSDEDDNEMSGLMGVGRSDDLAPPAPPKVKAKGPQTVSFADFDQSIPPGFVAPGPRPTLVNAQHVTGILRSASPRPGSDLNKPLPPPPQDTAATVAPTVPETIALPQQSSAIELSPAAGAKVVPPPPPTRKSGGGHGRARSSSNLSNITQDSTMSSVADIAAPGQPNKLAPPPPPTRKSHTAGQSAQSQTQQDRKQSVPPPPPLRRHPSKSERGSSTVSRQPSDDSTTAQRLVSAGANTIAIPPPPPPPRRPHGSKRTSLDGLSISFPRRSSAEHYRGTSFDSERSASISSLQKVAETSESAERALSSPGPDQSRDILAEMSAFQAELDALAKASNDK